MFEKPKERGCVERRRWPRDPSAETNATAETLSVINPSKFSTRDLASRDQFEAWRAHVAEVHDVSLPEEASAADGFPADHMAWNLGGFLVVQQNAPAHRFARPISKLRLSPIDHWQATIMRSGLSWTEVDGRVAENRPGTFHLGTLGIPFSGRATSAESLILYLPRDLFSNSLLSDFAVDNVVLKGGAAAMLISYFEGIERTLFCLTEQDLPLVTTAARAMILACLDTSASLHMSADSSPRIVVIEAARRYVQSNLRSENLSPAEIARAIGVSRTRLYQLFEASGGVLHYIQKRRMQAAHSALRDPLDTRRISDIAEAVGFSSAANFSRSFSKEYGYSPREARNGIVLDRRCQPTPIVSPNDKETTFNCWLKELGGCGATKTVY